MADNSDNNSKSNHGYVYILSNPSMPGLLKIGMTRFDPTRRVQELSSATGVPTQFQLIYYREFHNCVAAELEIHSVLAAKGMRYNDQREFFSVDSVEAINTLLSLEDECVDDVSEDLVEVRNFNEDIDWNKDYSNRRALQDEIRNTEQYKELDDFVHSTMFNIPFLKEDTEKLRDYVDKGFLCYVEYLADRLFDDKTDELIAFILRYTTKGYVSGYVEVVQKYLESIGGIDNLPQSKKVWVATMLNKFAKEFRNVSVYDFFVDQKIEVYCGISRALGLQYDKSFLKAASFDDDSIFNTEWMWNDYFGTGEEKSKKLGDLLRADKDEYCGTSAKEEFDLLSDDNYKKFHSSEGLNYYNQARAYLFGTEDDSVKVILAKMYFKMAIDSGYKKAYRPYSLLFSSDKEQYLEVLHEGAMDSCPQCLMLAVDRMLNGVISEELTKGMRHKINRYLDLFISQVDLAFWVDAFDCLEAIKIFISVSIAFQRKINKNKLREVIAKIKSISDIDESDYYFDMAASVACFDDYELIEQQAVLTMKDLVGSV